MSTTHNEPKPSSFDDPVRVALDFEEEGKIAEALAVLEPHLLSLEQQDDVFQAASRAALAALLNPSLLAEWPEQRRVALYRNLVLQGATSDAAPALHARIASSHSARIEDALEMSAAALQSTLSSLWEEGDRSPSFLLMVLLLRQHLKGWPYRAEISRWHTQLLPHLTRPHFSLPYNWAFDQENFRDNVNDIDQLLKSSSSEEIALRYAPWQIILFHWITKGRTLDLLLPAIIDALHASDSGEARAESDIAAIRSLSLRAMALGLETNAPLLQDHAKAQGRQWSVLRKHEHNGAERAARRLDSKHWQAINAVRALSGQKMPFLKLGRRQPRIAVCVSGQLRGYRRALPSWRRTILQGADCHVFVHTWKLIGRSGAEPHRAFLPFSGQEFCSAYREQVQRIGLTEAMSRYPNLFTRLSQNGEVSKADLCDYYETDDVVVEDDTADRFANWPNSRKLHYKISAAHELVGKRQAEFDLVLRIRPDKELGLSAFAWSDLMRAATGPVIYADIGFGHQYTHPIIGDQLAIGTPDVMRTYAETYQLVPELAALGMFDCTPDYHGHASLARTCWHAGIDVRRLPVRMGRLLEADAMPAKDIADCLGEDARGRMNAMDKILIAANRRDLQS